jgi:hypothetical protein
MSATLAPITTADPPATVEVATYTHANGIEQTGDFTATVDWGIDSHRADPGTITQDGSGTYHVSALRPMFSVADTYTVTVSISEENASTMVTDTQEVDNFSPIATTTALSSSANPSVFGQAVTFTATVTPASGSGTPTGTVTFMDGSATLGTGSLSGGQASLTTSFFVLGARSITALYSGDLHFLPSTSSTLTQTVNQDASTTTITSSDNPANAGESLTITVTVSASAPGSGMPTGSVTLMIPGKVTYGTALLNASGQASFAIGTMASGTHLLTASYAGDSNFVASNGSVVQTVGITSNSATTVTSSNNPARRGALVTFTATVTGAGNTPTGTVTFFDAKVSLTTQTLNASGVATFATSTLSPGTHNIFARYTGDAKYNSSSSNVVTQSVKSLATATVVASQAAVPQVIVKPAPFSLVVTVPTASTAGSAKRIDAGVAASAASALEQLAMSGALTCRNAAATLKEELQSHDRAKSLDAAALDRFFSEL